MSRAAGAAGAKAAEADKQSRLLEMFTVAILGIATVASAWCAFQSSRWNDVSDDEARTATDLRVEQSRLYSQGTQIGLYDTQIVTAYASAVADKNEALQTFLHDSLMRPALVPIVDDWLAAIRDGATDVERRWLPAHHPVHGQRAVLRRGGHVVQGSRRQRSAPAGGHVAAGPRRCPDRRPPRHLTSIRVHERPAGRLTGCDGTR